MNDNDPKKPDKPQAVEDDPIETKSEPPKQDMKIDPPPLPPRT